MSSAADRNLLFGILAVQMDFVTPPQLVAAMNAWVLAKSKPLGQHLVDAGVLNPATRDLLGALVDKHIEQHGGQIEQSLAAISSTGGVRGAVEAIKDADVQASLRRVPLRAPQHPTPASDANATIMAPAPRREEAARFTILRPHASGGLGRVSVARDGELNREVALKELLDSHADDPDSRARFLQEAEITGGLEHPGVVPIYGLGQYADGRPFYAMRFIRGDSLRDAIERFHAMADPRWTEAATQLQLRRLLGRLIDVCNAIDYAHSRGVLHRDLKPGNVMLGQYGETLVVDWGLAKATGSAGVTVRTRGPAPDSTVRVLPEPLLTPSGSAGSAPTQMGSAVGTPAFMSPEQAAGRLDQLGPASDIFSLGATLYVLLTGRAPQDDDDLGTLLLRVQRGEFPAPRTLKPCIPRGLEAICLKAMALNPADRYATPRAMADDLEAWLADEPVAAMPEPLTARTRRWVKKHRALVSTLAGVTLVSLAGALLGVATLTAANQRERAAKEAAQSATAEAERQGGRNAELLDLAKQSLDKYEALTKRDELQRYGMEQLRGELLEAALKFYETLAKQTGATEEARADRAEAFYRIGNTYWQMGRVDDSRRAYESGRELFEKLEAEAPTNWKYRRAAAVINAAIGENLVNVQRAVDAAAPLAASRARLLKMHAEKPDEVDVAAVLAYGWQLEGERLRQTGDFPAAHQCYNREMELLRQALAKKPTGAELLNLQFKLADALNHRAKLAAEGLWKFRDAEQDHAEARAIYAQLSAEKPADDDRRFNLAQTVRYQGEVASRSNQIAVALARYEEAAEMLERLAKAQPQAAHFRSELAESLFLAGTLDLGKDKVDPAKREQQLQQIQRAIELKQQLSEQAPARTDHKLSVARFRGQLGIELSRRGREEEAQEEYTAALDLMGQLAETADRNLDNRLAVATLTYDIAKQLAEAKRNPEALDLYGRAEDLYRQIQQLAPAFSQARFMQCSIHLDRAAIYLAQDLSVDCLRELDQVARISDELKDKADILLMQGGFRAVVTGAAAMRMIQTAAIRDGCLKTLADEKRFDELLGQATAWGAYTGLAADHFVAGQALAYGVDQAAGAAGQADAVAAEVAEKLATTAVAELRLAAKGGHFRRESRFGGLFSSRPTAADLESGEQWRPLQDRADFKQLISEIRAAKPENSPAEATDAGPGDSP